jgi:hypothetical protein
MLGGSVRHRAAQIGFGVSVVLLIAAAVIATVLQRFFVAPIVPGIAFALAAVWFRRKLRALSEPGPGLARIDVQSRIEYWDAPELDRFKSRPGLVAAIASMSPGTIGCFLDVGSDGVILEPGQLMRLAGLARTDIAWQLLDHVQVRLGGGPLGNSVSLHFASSGELLVARYPSDVDLAPTLAAAVARSTNPDIPVEIVRPDSPKWQAW